MNRTLIRVALALAIASAGSPGRAADQNRSEDDHRRGLQLFEQTILPAMAEHCFDCHSQASGTTEAGLELDTSTGLLQGGDSGPMFRAHQADQSQLLSMLRHQDNVSAMPPEERLPDEVIAAFEDWIRLGAPDSRSEDGPTAKQRRLEQAKRHWSLLPPQQIDLPTVQDPSWLRNPVIDSFLLSAMEAEGLRPVGDANRRTLVRRVFFDLVGLPPTPQDIEAFVNDTSPQAFEALVDRLLDSPRFGERWGRHWLDVVRYAESSGMEFNFTYPHAWPYRNYVIDSFNEDKPFDQFVCEQIAGDLMPAEENESELAAQQRLVATSLLAFGPKRHNSSGTEFQMDIADDQIDVVMKATMALTVSCSRCHDHKFDPIPTNDYYSLAGVFLSTEPLYGTIKQKYSNTPTELLPIGSNAETLHEAVEEYEKQILESEKKLAETREALKQATEAEQLAEQQKVAAEGLVAAILARQSARQVDANGAETESATNQTAEQDAAKSDLERATKEVSTAADRVASLKANVTKLETGLAELNQNRPPRPQYAMSVRDREKPADTRVAVRGDFRTRGDVVPRGFLSAVDVPGTSAIPPHSSGRLELAKWITSPDNPLTARVMVNRIWHHLFGRGIVPTVDNFGVIGKPPTHPELLDALALQFVSEGWSVKRMVRSIVLSRGYQLSSRADQQNLSADPDNRLFWRATPRRLQAEAIRDAMLVVSGQLDLERPEASTVTGLGDQLVREIATEKIQPPSNHRSVYLPVVRDYVPELFDLFDFPSPSLVSGRRASTNVPSQALFMRNSPFVAAQARAAAQRLIESTEATDNPSRAALAMQWTLGRTPSEAEQSAAVSLVSRVADEAEEDAEVHAWSAWFLTLFTTAEFRYLVDIES